MTEAAARILIVDDDAALRELLQNYLEREGYRVDAVGDGVAMDRWFDTHAADLLVLDLMLPGEDGLSIARRLSAEDRLPIIILSARGDDVDRIVGLEVGADDYLAKPFNPRELLARIRAVLRRHGPAAPTAGTPERLRFGPYALDVDGLSLTRDGHPVSLTSGEMDLLLAFAAHPGSLLSRDRLLDLLKGYERNPFDRSIDVLVARLRGKIEEDSRNPRFIRTLWGKGYVFTPSGEHQ